MATKALAGITKRGKTLDKQIAVLEKKQEAAKAKTKAQADVKAKQKKVEVLKKKLK